MNLPFDNTNLGKFDVLHENIVGLGHKSGYCVYDKQSGTITINYGHSIDTIWADNLAVVVYNDECGSYAVLKDGSILRFCSFAPRHHQNAFATFNYMVTTEGLDAVIVPVAKNGVLMIMKKSVNCVSLSEINRLLPPQIDIYFPSGVNMGLRFPIQKLATDWRDAFFNKNKL